MKWKSLNIGQLSACRSMLYGSESSRSTLWSKQAVKVVYKAFSIFRVQWKFTAADYELQTFETNTGQFLHARKDGVFSFVFWTPCTWRINLSWDWRTSLKTTYMLSLCCLLEIMHGSLCSLSIFGGCLGEGRSSPGCTDANVFTMWGVPETGPQWSSRRLPLPCPLIALAPGRCRGSEDDSLLTTTTSVTQPGQVLIAQILRGTFRSFRPKKHPRLCAKDRNTTYERQFVRFSASRCVGTPSFPCVCFTFVSTILIPRSSFRFYAHTSARQMCVVDWTDKQLVRTLSPPFSLSLSVSLSLPPPLSAVMFRLIRLTLRSHVHEMNICVNPQLSLKTSQTPGFNTHNNLSPELFSLWWNKSDTTWIGWRSWPEENRSCVFYIDCRSALFSLAAALQTCRISVTFCTTLSVSIGVCACLCVCVLFI